jgi:hypothetical protein
MKIPPGQINLVLAWLWILLGFVSGMLLGLFFHGENWLGGYTSFKRRMYRLGHISFFGLGAVNLLFYFTLKSFAAGSPLAGIASWAFILGALSMPICSVWMAHFPKAHLLFAVPVLSLIAGGALTLTLVVRSDDPKPGGTSYTSPQSFEIRRKKSGTCVTRPSEYEVLRPARLPPINCPTTLDSP